MVLAEKIDQIIRAHDSTGVAENLDRLLRYLGSKIRRPSDDLVVDVETEFTVIDVVSPADFRIYLEWLKSEGLSNLLHIAGTRFNVALTRAGWARLRAPIQRKGGIPGTCFVATSFDDSLDTCYFDGILPAVEECGCTAIRLKEIQHNGDINDRILSEIRQAEFVVADFTQQKAGVYYEAGFARALGREVIMTCRADDFENLHFDTNHLNHIKWTTPTELRGKLADRIRATILPKA